MQRPTGSPTQAHARGSPQGGLADPALEPKPTRPRYLRLPASRPRRRRLRPSRPRCRHRRPSRPRLGRSRRRRSRKAVLSSWGFRTLRRGGRRRNSSRGVQFRRRLGRYERFKRVRGSPRGTKGSYTPNRSSGSPESEDEPSGIVPGARWPPKGKYYWFTIVRTARVHICY